MSNPSFAISPGSLTVEETILRRVALQGGLINSQIPPPGYVPGIVGYIKLLSAPTQSGPRAQTQGGVLGQTQQSLFQVASSQPDSGRQPPQIGPGTGPAKIAEGMDVIRAFKLIPDQQPITLSGGAMGDITLTPGANIGARILIVAAPLYVYYVDGKYLYEAYTPDFIRNIWLTAFAQGAARAEWLIPLIKAEFAFIEAFIAPMWLVFGITIVEWLSWYDQNKQKLHAAVEPCRDFNKDRLEMKKRFPTLYNTVLLSALNDLFANLAEGVEITDIAYFVGRVVGRLGLFGKFQAGIKLTLKVVIKVIAEYAFLVSAIHSLGILKRAAEVAAEEENIRERLADGGFNVSRDDAVKIATELVNDKGTKEFLEHMQKTADAFRKAIEDIGEIPGP